MGVIEKIFIVSFIVFAIWYTMQPREVFGSLGQWFKSHLPEKIHDPVYSCPACMVPYYGSAAYWAIWGLWLKAAQWQEWIVIIIAGIGLNAILLNLFPPDEE